VSGTPGASSTSQTISARPQRDLRWHLRALWLTLAALLVTATRTDPDLWGHLRFGLDFLDTHELPAVDPYSFTQDRPWINHEWLSEVLTAIAFRGAGSSGIVLLKVALVASAIAVLFWRLRGASAVVATIVASAAIVSALPLTGTMRPQIWSLLGLALLMIFLDPDGEPTRLKALALSALFAVWANLHGGWITGAAALGVYCTIRSIRNHRQAIGWILLYVVTMAATLLNPYGVALWRFLAMTVRASRPDISEWQPFSFHEPAIMWVSVLVPVLAVGGLAWGKTKSLRAETWAVACLLILAGLRVSRVAPLVAPAVLVLLSPQIAARWGAKGRLPRVSTAAMLVFAIPVLTAVAAVRAPVAAAVRCLTINDSWAPDRQAAGYLAGAHGRLWVAFDWGEYAIWHFGPKLRVSIDGRRETVYSDDIIRWHRAFELGDPGAQARFSQIGPEYVWLRSDRLKPRDWLETNGYRLEALTSLSFVAVRRDLPPLESPVAMMPACFP
jgi:hypothetical protein